MSEPVGASRPGLSMQEAAVAMGVSLNTMRRWCAIGRVRSERISRPQGYTVRVYLDRVPTQEPPVEGAAQEPQPTDTQEPPGTYQQGPIDLARAEAMAAYNRELVAPLVAELAAYRERLEDLARQNGTLAAELGQARAHAAELEAKLEAATRAPDPEPAPDPFP